MKITAVLPDLCELERYDDDLSAARAVLRNRHLVFVGDSLTRYQYISLVLFLESGRFTTAPDLDVTWEKEFGNWTHFLETSNSVLNGHELCDCHRGTAAEMLKAFENRYYHNPELDIRVTYIQWFGGAGTRVHHELVAAAVGGSLLTAAFPPCSPAYCNEDDFPLYSAMTAEGFARLVLPALQPDVIVWNCGLWTQCGNNLKDLLLGPSLSALRHRSISTRNVIWKTSTVKKAAKEPLGNMYEGAEFREAGARVMPAGMVTAAFSRLRWPGPASEGGEAKAALADSDVFRDGLHYHWPVYRELNMLLLNMLAH